MYRFLTLSPTLSRILMAPAGEGEGGGGGGGSETSEQKTAREKAEADKKKADEEKIDPLTTDIKTAIEKARKQEKDKLYGQIEEMKKTAKTAEELAASRATELDTVKKQLADLQAQFKKGAGEGEGDDDKKKSKKITEEDLNKAIEVAVDATAKQFDGALSEYKNRIAELEKANTEKDLVAYREQLISANKDAIIPELVTGTTREELDQSLVLAKQTFARVAQKLGKQVTSKGGEGEGGAAPEPKHTIQLPPTPNVNDQGAPGAPQNVDVKQLSSTDFAKNRAALLKAAGDLARKSLADG